MDTLKYFFAILFCAFTFVGCQKEEKEEIKPSGITNIQTEELPGKIKITWNREEPVTYEYIKVTYFDHLTKQNAVRLASAFADSIVLPNTRAKFGNYNIKLQPVSSSKTLGQEYNVIATSGPAPKQISFTDDPNDAENISLVASQIISNAPQAGTDVAFMIDGVASTIYHSAWQNIANYPFPHYFEVSLVEKIQGFKFDYISRASRNDESTDIKKLKVEASNDGITWVEVGEQEFSLATGNSGSNGQTYNSRSFLMDDEYKNLRFTVVATRGADPVTPDRPFFSINEFRLYKEPLVVIDPEK